MYHREHRGHREGLEEHARLRDLRVLCGKKGRPRRTRCPPGPSCLTTGADQLRSCSAATAACGSSTSVPGVEGLVRRAEGEDALRPAGSSVWPVGRRLPTWVRIVVARQIWPHVAPWSENACSPQFLFSRLPKLMTSRRIWRFSQTRAAELAERLRDRDVDLVDPRIAAGVAGHDRAARLAEARRVAAMNCSNAAACCVAVRLLRRGAVEAREQDLALVRGVASARRSGRSASGRRRSGRRSCRRRAVHVVERRARVAGVDHRDVGQPSSSGTSRSSRCGAAGRTSTS